MSVPCSNFVINGDPTLCLLVEIFDDRLSEYKNLSESGTKEIEFLNFPNRKDIFESLLPYDGPLYPIPVGPAVYFLIFLTIMLTWYLIACSRQVFQKTQRKLLLHPETAKFPNLPLYWLQQSKKEITLKREVRNTWAWLAKRYLLSPDDPLLDGIDEVMGLTTWEDFHVPHDTWSLVNVILKLNQLYLAAKTNTSGRASFTILKDEEETEANTEPFYMTPADVFSEDFLEDPIPETMAEDDDEEEEEEQPEVQLSSDVQPVYDELDHQDFKEFPEEHKSITLLPPLHPVTKKRKSIRKRKVSAVVVEEQPHPVNPIHHPPIRKSILKKKHEKTLKANIIFPNQEYALEEYEPNYNLPSDILPKHLANSTNQQSPQINQEHQKTHQDPQTHRHHAHATHRRHETHQDSETHRHHEINPNPETHRRHETHQDSETHRHHETHQDPETNQDPQTNQDPESHRRHETNQDPETHQDPRTHRHHAHATHNQETHRQHDTHRHPKADLQSESDRHSLENPEDSQPRKYKRENKKGYFSPSEIDNKAEILTRYLKDQLPFENEKRPNHRRPHHHSPPHARSYEKRLREYDQNYVDHYYDNEGLPPRTVDYYEQPLAVKYNEDVLRSPATEDSEDAPRLVLHKHENGEISMALVRPSGRTYSTDRFDEYQLHVTEGEDGEAVLKLEKPGESMDTPHTKSKKKKHKKKH